MRPANNFHQHQHQRHPHQHHHHHHHHRHQEQKLINGPRPTPLKISKESHLIHKMSSSSSVMPVIAPAMDRGTKQKRNQPVIIYMHSPKVIHAQPRDFMALVQKLTGNSSAKSPTGQKQDQDHDAKAGSESGRPADDDDNNESSSVVVTNNNGGSSGDAMSPILNPPRIANFADIPLFTPNSSNLFCSPRLVYRFPDSLYPSPNMVYTTLGIEVVPTCSKG